ncbi:MAG: glycosyltransferase family 2 protein [Bernardetiaceae bacterium]
MKVSVCMPVYNAERFLAEAIESVLYQSFQDFELLVINDGSTDGSSAILAQYAHDSRVRVLHNPENKGLFFTRNRYLQEARGDYIALLDADDVALPERLSRQVAILDNRPDLGLVGSAIERITETGQPINRMTFETDPERLPALLLFQNCFAQSTVMFRRAFARLGYREAFPPAEDYELWCRMARETRLMNISEPLVKYREHTGGISKRRQDLGRAAVRLIHRQQLEALGIQPTEDQLTLHHGLAHAQFERDTDFIEQALTWLQTIHRAGNSPALTQLLSEYAQKVIAHQLPLKPDTLHKIRQYDLWEQLPRTWRLRVWLHSYR